MLSKGYFEHSNNSDTRLSSLLSHAIRQNKVSLGPDKIRFHLDQTRIAEKNGWGRSYFYGTDDEEVFTLSTIIWGKNETECASDEDMQEKDQPKVVTTLCVFCSVSMSPMRPLTDV